MATYIYCFINEAKRRSFGKIGINGQEVRLLPYRDISAAASDINVVRLDSLDKENVLECVGVHQKVNEALSSEYDVAPMTFGMIAQDEEDALRMLGKCYFQLKAALRNIAGKTEFAVQVSWNKPFVLQEIFRTHPDLQELKRKAQSAGIGGIRAKIKLGKLLYEKAELQRKSYAAYIDALLKNVSHDMKFNALTDEQMIVNISCLIDKSKEEELDKQITQLGAEFDGRLHFKYIGPMPSYSFTSINFSLGNFELIDEARRTLGVKERASWRDIQHAYYALAQKYHPDKHGGSSGAGEVMKKIIQAHRTLEHYCQNAGDLLSKEHGALSFKKEDIESSILTNVNS